MVSCISPTSVEQEPRCNTGTVNAQDDNVVGCRFQRKELII